MPQNDSVPGRASAPGTATFASRPGRCGGHFRQVSGLSLSSIGQGTYLGATDDATDRRYEEATAVALACGANVFDSASNYRAQRGERALGRALAAAFAAGVAAREDVFVSTKGGFLAFDGAPPRDPKKWFLERFDAAGIATPEDLVAGCHILTPAFLEDQIEQSCRNLGLSTIDLYYVHNPETQLEKVGWPELERRLRLAFETLEKAVDSGRIARYGVATWNALRLPPGSAGVLQLEKLVALARSVAGERNRFAAVQLPLNVAMPEAFVSQTQTIDGEPCSALEAASSLGLSTFASASICQARVLGGQLPPVLVDAFPGLACDAQRALQFTRSTPGLDVALVGVGRATHARETFGLAKFPPASFEQFLKLFSTV